MAMHDDAPGLPSFGGTAHVYGTSAVDLYGVSARGLPGQGATGAGAPVLWITSGSGSPYPDYLSSSPTTYQLGRGIDFTGLVPDRVDSFSQGMSGVPSSVTISSRMALASVALGVGLGFAYAGIPGAVVGGLAGISAPFVVGMVTGVPGGRR